MSAVMKQPEQLDSTTKMIACEQLRLRIEEMDLADLMDSFNACRSAMKDGITLPAHKLVYEQEYLRKNSKTLAKFAHRLFTSHKELNIEAVISKLALKLPLPKGFLFNANGERQFDNFQGELLKYALAAVITEVFVDKKLFRIRQDIVYTPKPRTVSYVLLGHEDAKKDLLTGYDPAPYLTKVTHTSNGYRLNKSMRDFMLEMTRLKFIISPYFTPELVLHGYKLSGGYNGEADNESKIKREYRYETTYLEAWKELQALPHFHLPVYPCDRLRLYYVANKLPGARPQGKLWETLAIDSYNCHMITDKAFYHIVHIMVSLIDGKCSLDQACDAYQFEWRQPVNRFLKEAAAADPFGVEKPDVPFLGNEDLYRKAESEFGRRILLNKCYEATMCYEKGLPCHSLFGKDLTNSGLIMAGNSFKSEKMLEGGNCAGSPDVQDSHNQFGEAHNLTNVLTRDKIKSIHTPLLHGSSAYAIAEMINTYSEGSKKVTDADVTASNVKAYGHEVHNIEAIASFGYYNVNNSINRLEWTLPDGSKAFHRAVMEHTPIKVFAASRRKKGQNYHAYKLNATMPLAVDSEGRDAFSSKLGVLNKRRGLFANMTHSIDAYVLRSLCRTLLDSGSTFLLKHDDYMVPPADFNIVVSDLQKSFSSLRDTNLYQQFLNEIGAKLGVDVPELIEGEAENKIFESTNFLMP